MAGTRPKGNLYDWSPRPQTVNLLATVNQVLREQQAYLPLTARQIFYMLVGQHNYDKTEQAYARLCEAMVKGRRAGMLSWSAIRDDGTVDHHAGGYDSPKQWWSAMRYHAQSYVRDVSAGQDVRIELWCEAAGMAPQLARTCRPYGVSVHSTGGFSSVTVTREIASRVTSEYEDTGQPTVFMHVGDYDPSGESIFEAMAEDVQAFVTDGARDADGDVFRPERLALTADQVREHSLPTAPPKKSDSRTRNWTGQTCQLEAMAPPDLAAIIQRFIEAELDMDLVEQIRSDQATERAALIAEVNRYVEGR